MDISFSDESGHKSVPNSVSSYSQEMCFYSAPTSPSSSSRFNLYALSGFQTCTTTPTTTYEDANSNVDEFEFETSRRFNLSVLDNETSQKDEKPCDHKQFGDSFPTMAFADELFCDGKVLPLMPPLKLPPRLLLENGNGKKMSTQSSSTASSPRSLGLVLRLSFPRHSSWNDDFDPFMVALEKVKEEKRGKPKEKKCLRRSRSFSPFRAFNKCDKRVGSLTSTKQSEPTPDEGKEEHRGGQNQKQSLNQSSGITLVRVGDDGSFEPKRTSVSKLAVEKKNDVSKTGGSRTRKNKREKITKFLFGNAYMGKARAQHKLENQKAALGKQSLLRKLDMKSEILTQSTHWDKDVKTAGEISKMTTVCQKPGLFLCLRY